MSSYSFRPYLIAGIIVLLASASQAQLIDSLQFRTGLEYRFSSENYQPFWLTSNRFGTVANRKSDLVSMVGFKNKHVLAEHEYPNQIGLYDQDELALSYGLNIYNNNHFKSTFAEEAYIKLEYKTWSLRGGRFEETTGDIDPELSSGSMGVSGNARPIPKIGIAVTDYTNVPFTNGWLQFKGTFAHGWFGNDRYVKNSYYHEKTFFLRAGGPRLKFYAGFEHFAEWGGQGQEPQFDKSLGAFKKILFVKSMTDVIPIGDQRGVLDGGLYWTNDDITVHAYLQKLFEGRKDIGIRTFNGMAGAELTFKNKETGFQKLLLEVVSTKSINEKIAVTQRKSYYNSNLYKTGWEYESNVIGTPLFINRTRASNYFPGLEPFDWNPAMADIPGNANIVSNRVFAIHAGALYNISQSLAGKSMLTFVKNYGAPENNVSFAGKQNEMYGLQDFRYYMPEKDITLKAAIGFDMGDLAGKPVAGFLFGVEWIIPIFKNTNVRP